jgi:chromosome segregation protein
VKLKTIELVGFKSFAKKSRLDFAVPVVGIVGPNGSGKSNVVEAFRFVLGEQSMKSLRGKSGKDLVFKGSKDLPKGNRAAVEITFDNKDRIFKLGDRSEPINLDFDEIILKREVFADGNNNYYINNSSVRLKDIVELLASVNIGASGHHIISQGQADRILTSSSKDRRLMIEDALGLKVYQNRLKESGKKLEKTEENMKEVGLLRRELAPHIKYLKKQVEKIEKSEELRTELSRLYLAYSHSEEKFLREEESLLKDKMHGSEREVKEIEVKLASMRQDSVNVFEQEKQVEIANLQKEIESLERTKEELSRKLGRIEGVIEYQKKAETSGPESISINSKELSSFIDDMSKTIESTLSDSNLDSIKSNLQNIRGLIESFKNRFAKMSNAAPTQNSFKDLETTKRDVSAQLEEIERVRSGLLEKVRAVRQSLEDNRANAFKDQAERFTLENRMNRILADEEILRSREANFISRKSSFENEMKEAVALVGSEILGFRNSASDVVVNDETRRMIERIKIRLEDTGTGSGADVMKEYKETTERDEFLAKELLDLDRSIANLRTLIDELKVTLDTEFKGGLERINKRFEEFFTQMFGGGSAYLSNVIQGAKKNSVEEDGEEDEESGSGSDDLEYGIDINVNLPEKKVKDLHMLSGGERSLTSIALVFAMTQVNPPPFLVLDETDAALDEANSKRYGDMIEMLSKYSNLITVTHNRETMSRADVIYGVTIGSDGSSKLLSIRFDDAEAYAK